MFWIILTGVLTLGVLPLLAIIGFGVSLVVNIFTMVSWGYWQCVAVGFLVAVTAGVIRSNSERRT